MRLVVEYTLCVDYYANKIMDSDSNEWYWQGTDFAEFYSTLLFVVHEIKDQQQ
jgi:hypothetical protein